MLEFKVIKEIKPNKKILDTISSYEYKVAKGEEIFYFGNKK